MLILRGLAAVFVAVLTSMTSHEATAGIYLPEFAAKPASASMTPGTLRTRRFRVLVYPHLSEYSVPQGREPASVAAVARITSPDGCDVYPARKESDGTWVPAGARLERWTEFTISAARKAARSALYHQCSGPFTVLRPAPLKSYSYEGDFVSLIDQRRALIINLVEPDRYLRGVIPSEVPAAWPLEVLKAQAVAARTYAWWSVQVARARPSDYDMDDTVSYQAYLGTASRAAATDEATESTAGLILKHQGQPIKAYFSADSGGFTESALSAFGTALPYCIARAEEYDLSTSLRPDEWVAGFTLTGFQSLLSAGRGAVQGLFPRGVRLTDLRILERNDSGRVQKLKALAANGKTYVISAGDFRYVTKIRSTLFSIARQGATLTLRGRGYGHGVGMAQIGAHAYHTQLGWSFDRILEFYYPQTVLETP